MSGLNHGISPAVFQDTGPGMEEAHGQDLSGLRFSQASMVVAKRGKGTEEM